MAKLTEDDRELTEAPPYSLRGFPIDTNHKKTPLRRPAAVVRNAVPAIADESLRRERFELDLPRGVLFSG